jgi:hypothetical protein
LLQKLAESFISPVFETSESCKKLQNIAIPDRETGLIKVLQADAAKKTTAKQGSILLRPRPEGAMRSTASRRIVQLAASLALPGASLRIAHQGQDGLGVKKK